MDTDSTDDEIVFAKPFRFTSIAGSRMRFVFEDLRYWVEVSPKEPDYEKGARAVIGVAFGTVVDRLLVQQTVEEIDAQYSYAFS